PQHERAAVLERARELVRDRADAFARSIAEEAGKPLKTARAEVARCQDTLLFAAVEARKLAGSVVPFEASSNGAGKLGFTLHHPKGVVAAITPFNFPLNLVAHKLAPAFAAGCPVVLKPAGDTPLTALLLARTLAEAGMPRGFLNVVTGPSAQVGAAITAPDAVAVISFTGSTQVGRALAEANPHKTVLLELGNNTPVIVDASADLRRAAAKLAATGYSFAGQSCISAQRVYVHRQMRDDFVALLTDAVAALKVGDPLDADTDVGPLIRPEDRDRVVAWIREAQDAGAKLRLGGEVNADGTLQPAILDDVTPDMKVSSEEVFGPVLAVQPVADLDEAIRLANATRYGLQAGIFTGDLAAALRAARELVFGGVTVNESPTYRADQMPYGGVRDSGNTREGPAYAVRDYLEETVVVVDLG
ncbi:MAG: aldehyde dehydrogenase family protein, partial [Actinomycetota bacterium]|nr:aldehyde dehydrogenase family protein [Actinomycetota bacterium]